MFDEINISWYKIRHLKIF